MPTTAHPLFSALARLALPPQDFVLCGSAPLFARGLRAEVGDLDVLARGEAWNIIRRLAPPSRPRSGHGVRVAHPGAAIEFFDRWTPGWDTGALIDGAEAIDGIRYMPLRHLEAWKRHAQRPKDTADLAILSTLRAC
jgi:hypothetical protein